MNSVIPILGHNRLDYIRRLLDEGHKLIVKGGQDWVEGSLQVASALKAAKENWPANIGFSAWLKQEKLDVFSHQDRSALINLASDIELARAILTETDSRSYQRIWAANKKRFTSASKTPRPQRKSGYKKGRVMIFREMKLGTETMQKIKGTSLDSAEEMDELIMLNRGAVPGELTSRVAQLVADAVEGKEVSAIAAGGAHKVMALVQAWRKRMVASWLRASKEERLALIKHLTEHLEDSK